MKGFNKSSSSNASLISDVNRHASAGQIILTNGEILGSEQPIEAGTKIYIDGSSNKVYLSGVISIQKYPLATQVINIDMNKILTPGT